MHNVIRVRGWGLPRDGVRATHSGPPPLQRPIGRGRGGLGALKAACQGLAAYRELRPRSDGVEGRSSQ